MWRWTLLLGMGSSKEERGRTRFLSKGEFGRGVRLLAHTQSFPWPLSTPPHSSPSTSHPPFSLPWPQGPHPSAYFALTNTVATPPTHSTISWTTLLHLHLVIPTPHTCAVTAAAIKGSLVRSVYSTVLFAIHICAPSSHMMGPASGPFCPLLYCT